MWIFFVFQGNFDSFQPENRLNFTDLNNHLQNWKKSEKPLEQGEFESEKNPQRRAFKIASKFLHNSGQKFSFETGIYPAYDAHCYQCRYASIRARTYATSNGKKRITNAFLLIIVVCITSLEKVGKLQVPRGRNLRSTHFFNTKAITADVSGKVDGNVGEKKR